MNNNSLFILIKTLTKSEKRYFKMLSNNQKGNKQYLEIFDAIDKQKDYNETQLKDIFKSYKLSKQFNVYKQYLYQLILKSLLSFNSKTNEKIKVNQLLLQIEILFNRGLIDDAYSFLKKIKKIVYKKEMLSELLKILVLEQTMATHIKTINRNSIKNEYDVTINKLKTLYDYTALVTEILILNNQKKHKNSNTLMQKIKNYEKKPILKSINLATTLQAKSNFYTAHLLLNYLKNDYQKAFELSSKNTKLISNKLSKNSPDRIIPYHNHISVSIQGSQFKVAEEYLDKLNQLYKINEKKLSAYQKYDFVTKITINQLAICLKTGSLQKEHEIIKDFQKNPKKLFIIKPKESFLIWFYYYITILYIIDNNYEKALEWNNRLFNILSIHDGDFYINTRFLNLIIHFELHNISLLESQLQSVSRLLLKQNYSNEFESVIFSFFKSMLKINDFDFNLSIVNLVTRLNKIEQNEIRDSYLSHFDYLSWAKSKLERKPMSTIIKESLEKN